MTKQEKLTQLTAQRDAAQASLDAIIANKSKAFSKGNVHIEALEMHRLQQRIDYLNNKIVAWENSSL